MNSTELSKYTKKSLQIFSGNVYLFYAFDIGDDIDLEKITKLNCLQTKHLHLPKSFKNYHAPLAVELPHPHNSGRCMSVKVHQFGAISLTYKVPFTNTLPDLRKTIIDIDSKFHEQSVQDAHALFKKIKNCIVKPKFFHHKTHYPVIQVQPIPEINGTQLKEHFGNSIASLIRFERELLSEAQKEDILENSIAYFKKDLIVIDSESTFIYDPQYEELLDFFELANIQQLELQYFDKILDTQLTSVYEQKTYKLPWAAFLPFIGSYVVDPVGELNKLKVDISVITERLENSIKLAGETYFSEIYGEITKKLDLPAWQESLEKKLEIIKEMRYLYQSKIDANREDLLSVLIIILILIELVVALYH